MIERKVVMRVTCVENGILEIRFDMQLFEGDLMLGHEYLATSLQPDGDLKRLIESVNHVLERRGFLEVESEHIERLKRLIGVEHSPKVKADFAEQLARNSVAVLAELAKPKKKLKKLAKPKK